MMSPTLFAFAVSMGLSSEPKSEAEEVTTRAPVASVTRIRMRLVWAIRGRITVSTAAISKVNLFVLFGEFTASLYRVRAAL